MTAITQTPTMSRGHKSARRARLQILQPLAFAVIMRDVITSLHLKASFMGIKAHILEREGGKGAERRVCVRKKGRKGNKAAGEKLSLPDGGVHRETG